MTINNSEKLGLVDDISSNSQIGETVKYLETNNKPPVDGSSPAINPQPYYPEGGQIISDKYFNHSNLGVVQVNSYSINTVENDELRLREIEKQRQSGRTIYNTAPLSSGAPFLSEEVKPTQKQLQQLQELELLRSMKSRLNNLFADEVATVNKLSGIRRSIENLKEELVNLEEELH